MTGNDKAELEMLQRITGAVFSYLFPYPRPVRRKARKRPKK